MTSLVQYVSDAMSSLRTSPKEPSHLDYKEDFNDFIIGYLFVYLQTYVSSNVTLEKTPKSWNFMQGFKSGMKDYREPDIRTEHYFLGENEWMDGFHYGLMQVNPIETESGPVPEMTVRGYYDFLAAEKEFDRLYKLHLENQSIPLIIDTSNFSTDFDMLDDFSFPSPE